ncbi:glycosyltransferase [Candidatus Omnitrophota bacterium]
MPGRLKQFYNNSGLLNAARAQITPFRIKKRRSLLLFDDSRFYRLNLNCRGDAYHGYVNIEDTRTKGRVFVSKLWKLPFSDNEAKFAFIDFETVKENKNLSRIFKELARVMVPNGILTIDNIEIDTEISSLLNDVGFSQVFSGSQKNLPVAHFVNSPRENFYDLAEFDCRKDRGCLIISSDRLEGSKKIKLEEFNPEAESLDGIKLVNALAYVFPESMESLLLKLKKFLNKDAVLEISVRNECFSENGKFISFFDKANLAQYLTETGFLIERLELQDGIIKAIARKKGMPEKLEVKIEKKKRICCIGQYMLNRYNQLGFGWDAIPRALDELGIDYLLLEGMRNIDKKALHEAILSFKPDYLLLILKETIPLLFDIVPELKKMGTKIIYWFCDPEHPVKQDLGHIIDVMFLSNRGQLDEYKEAYNLKRVYYMPQGGSPSILYHRDIPEIYDVGFTGALSKASLHNTRRKIFSELFKRYTVSVRNNVRNNVPEFYSQSKTVLGGSDFDYELCTSNRFYVALGCGACYVTKHFKGIELLAENKKHLLWFKEIKELFDILEYYIKHDSERNKVRQAASRLSLEKHTYKHRLQNILDIVDGKTESFYGFL